MRYIILFLFFNWITDSSPQLTKSELILNETHDEVITQSLEFLINRQKRDGWESNPELWHPRSTSACARAPGSTARSPGCRSRRAGRRRATRTCG